MANTSITRQPERRPETTGTTPATVQTERRAVAPAVDIFEDDKEILVFADLPGVQKDDLSVRLNKGELLIQGRRTMDTGDGAFDYVRRFIVPTGVDSSKISAELKLGVLELHLPKAEALRPRQIPVKSA